MTENVVDEDTGRIRVMARKCSTCIFRPGNPMSLHRGRLESMLRKCAEEEGHIPCHQTLSYYHPRTLPTSICAGFAAHAIASQRSLALRIARAMGGALYVGN